MSKIDEVKEEINYLKVWLGIVVVTNIGLISWLVNNYETSSHLKVIADIVATILLTVVVLVIDKKIKRKIKKLKDL